MFRPLTAFCVLLLATMAGPLAAEDEVSLATLMDETAVAVARIDITAEQPGATFAALAFGGQLVPSQLGDWPKVFQKLLTAAGVRHVHLILYPPTKLPTAREPFSMDAVCVIPFPSAEAATSFSKLPNLTMANRSWSIAPHGKYCLLGSADLVASALAEGHPQRPGIDAALAEVEDAPLALVIAPSVDQRRVLTSLLPTLPAEQGGDILRAWAEQSEWTTLAFKPEHSLRMTIQAKSPQSALALAGSLDAFLSGTVGKIRAINGHPVQLDAVLAALEQRVENDQILMVVDIAKLPPEDNVFDQFTLSALMTVNRQQAMQHLRQVGIAMQNHHDAMKRFPDAAIRGADGKPLLSWRVRLLPFLGETALYKEFHLDEPWDSKHNRKLIERMPNVYRIAAELPPGKTCVVLPIGAETAWPDGRGRVIREFTDGTSNTILIVEADDEHAVVWTQPADLAYDPANPAAGLGGHFGKGFVTGSADSAVHYLPLDANAETLRQLFTPAGREPVRWPGQ